MQCHPAASLGITADRISSGAKAVVAQLHGAGYQAHVVGGSIRDLLLGLQPKDFDVATNALPEQLKKLFRQRARMIGRRFRIVHVRAGDEIVEVTTFRAGDAAAKSGGAGKHRRHNVYGKTVAEDAARRDLSINALYYDPASAQLRDFHHGLRDLRRSQIRVIGPARQRYEEDPVRMLRTVRFAAKLGFEIVPESRQSIPRQASLLLKVPPARRALESQRLLLTGHGAASLRLLLKHQLLGGLFPASAPLIKADPSATGRGLEAIDRRTDRQRAGRSLLLGSFMLWPAYRSGLPDGAAWQEPEHKAQAALETIEASYRHYKLHSDQMPWNQRPSQQRELLMHSWMLQPRPGSRTWPLPDPKALGYGLALELLELRVASGEAELQPILGQWQANPPAKPSSDGGRGRRAPGRRWQSKAGAQGRPERRRHASPGSDPASEQPAKTPKKNDHKKTRHRRRSRPRSRAALP